MRRPADIGKPIPLDDVLVALRALDGDQALPTHH
jgi:hypothetical protein